MIDNSYLGTDASIRKSHIVSLSTMALCAIVALSFVFHLIIYTLSGTAYILLVFLMTIVYIISKPLTKTKINIPHLLWLLSLSIVAVGYARSQQKNAAMMDLIVLSSGVLLVLFHSKNVNGYRSAMKLIRAFSALFALGVLLQQFIPALYSVLLRVFPTNLENAIRVGVDESRGSIRGFSTNTGFTAGYISAGILAVASSFDSAKRKSVLFLLFLLVALLFTGKRGPIIFLFLTIMLCYLMTVRGSGKVKRYWKAFLVIFAGMILFLLFRDLLAQIPFFNKLVATIEGIVIGEDVTSSRSFLYIWSLKLFQESPLFGIGWGTFRTTVIGNTTLRTSLDVHNIYLQLLCETGIVGFICFVTTFFMSWNTTKNAYYQCVADNTGKASQWRQILFFSLAYQTFFLLYGLSGNPLYDQHYQILYMFSCSITAAYLSVQGLGRKHATIAYSYVRQQRN